MIIMVMDGQGGSIGATIIKGLRSAISEEVEILALGTNSIATSRMMKAGANRDATGENAIVHTSLESVDLLVSDGSQIKMINIFGEQKEVKAKIKALTLVDHKILLEPM